MDLLLSYYSDKVTTVNPNGNIGILTLWSKTEVITKKYGELPQSVCAISNYYGDGINQLLANLLANPQINHLIILGNNRTGSGDELIAYFERGVEEINMHGSKQYRIIGTTRLINSAVADCSLFDNRRPSIVKLYSDGVNNNLHIDIQIEKLRKALSDAPEPPRNTADRLVIQLAETKTEVYPSVTAGHQVVTDGLLDAWSELLFAITRFGIPTQLPKGSRKELLNLKVVVTNPKWHTDAEYQAYNTSEEALRSYCSMMMEPNLAADTTYTYGNRLREYYGYDMVEQAVNRLTTDKEDRKCFLSLWDPRLDMYDDNPDGSHRGHPCWVSGFFRVHDGRLSFTAVFRTHRAYKAWIENAHGLMNLQSIVADRIGVPIGPLTIFSESISIDPGQLDLVQSVIAIRKWKLRDDGRGELVFSINGDKAVVEHKMAGVVLKKYESQNIEALGHHLAQDMVVSDLNHSLYVGRQLGKLQLCLKHGLKYEES